jgi:hypothetical protein
MLSKFYKNKIMISKFVSNIMGFIYILRMDISVNLSTINNRG